MVPLSLLALGLLHKTVLLVDQSQNFEPLRYIALITQNGTPFLRAASLVTRLTLVLAGRPEDDDDEYISPSITPSHNNRSSSARNPLHGYQLQDQPYRPQPPHLQMPLASSDRLAMQPTVCCLAPVDRAGERR